MSVLEAKFDISVLLSNSPGDNKKLRESVSMIVRSCLEGEKDPEKRRKIEIQLLSAKWYAVDEGAKRKMNEQFARYRQQSPWGEKNWFGDIQSSLQLFADQDRDTSPDNLTRLVDIFKPLSPEIQEIIRNTISWKMYFSKWDPFWYGCLLLDIPRHSAIFTALDTLSLESKQRIQDGISWNKYFPDGNNSILYDQIVREIEAQKAISQKINTK